MILHPEHPDLRLFELSDLDLDPPPEEAAPYIDALRTIRTWMREYLCRPLANLGRKGAVCPYTQTALDRQTAYLAVRPGRPLSAPQVAEALRPYRDWFARLAPREDPASMYATVLILFPDAQRDDLPIIDATQALLKPSYVSEGLMIGEFHDGPPNKPGLWNPDLRPLVSPVPMLVIRHMVATDFPFLREDKNYVRAYVARFGDNVPAHLRDEVRAAIAALS